MTSRSDSAYGRADDTRSCVRFIFEVATISSVRVILRVFSTDLMRPLSSRPLAMARHSERREESLYVQTMPMHYRFAFVMPVVPAGLYCFLNASMPFFR